MKWLFTRIITAGVIFAFLCLVVTALAGFGAPTSNTDANPEVIREQYGDIDFAVKVFERYGGDGIMTVLLIVLPIVLVVGFSEGIGHSVVLFANQVKPSRFAASLLINAVLFVFGYLIWVFSIAAIAYFVFDVRESLVRALFAVAISYLPLIYGFMIAMPYAGVLIGNILYLLTAYRLYLALQVTYPFGPTEALICVVLGFLGVITFRLTIGRPFEWVSGHLRDAVAGTHVDLDLTKALEFEEPTQEAR
ncbi:hypothetical protein ACFLYO_07120 [Chloroflexota bacterium]